MYNVSKFKFKNDDKKKEVINFLTYHKDKKTIYDRDAGKDFIKESPHGTTGGRFMKQFFRLPVDPVIRDYKKSQIESQRREYMEELMERS